MAQITVTYKRTPYTITYDDAGVAADCIAAGYSITVLPYKGGGIYVMAHPPGADNDRMPLARFILGIEYNRKLLAHHINGDPLDLRAENLVVVTRAQKNALRKQQTEARRYEPLTPRERAQVLYYRRMIAKANGPHVLPAWRK